MNSIQDQIYNMNIIPTNKIQEKINNYNAKFSILGIEPYLILQEISGECAIVGTSKTFPKELELEIPDFITMVGKHSFFTHTANMHIDLKIKDLSNIKIIAQMAFNGTKFNRIEFVNRITLDNTILVDQDAFFNVMFDELYLAGNIILKQKNTIKKLILDKDYDCTNKLLNQRIEQIECTNEQFNQYIKTSLLNLPVNSILPIMKNFYILIYPALNNKSIDIDQCYETLFNVLDLRNIDYNDIKNAYYGTVIHSEDISRFEQRLKRKGK